MVRYRVWCEDCDLEVIYDSEEPPEQFGYQLNAKDAAMGERDGHAASAFRDYGRGLRHRVHLDRLD